MIINKNINGFLLLPNHSYTADSASECLRGAEELVDVLDLMGGSDLMGVSGNN